MYMRNINNMVKDDTVSSLSEPRSLGDENAIVEAVEVAAIKKNKKYKSGIIIIIIM